LSQFVAATGRTASKDLVSVLVLRLRTTPVYGFAHIVEYCDEQAKSSGVTNSGAHTRGRQKHWIKVKNREHHAFDRVKDTFH
jgi:hypothetical protein